MSKTNQELRAECVAHWKRMRDAENVDYGEVPYAESCAFCAAYNPTEESVRKSTACSGCPVAEHAGAPYCRNTPYAKAERAHRKWRAFLDPTLNSNARLTLEAREEWRRAADAEIAFLKSLIIED